VSGVSTHVLDLARGRPATGIVVRLDARAGAGWRELGRATTDSDGRVRTLLAPGAVLVTGVHRLTFELAPYFADRGVEAFYPEASVVFEVRDASSAHHVPLLLSPFGYSTYRGS
jgi:5-hydroxyisourate hydrolase